MGEPLSDMTVWDVLYGLREVRPVDHWVRAFAGLGVDFSVAEINARLLRWVETAMVQCGR
jgi:hypothetical protein